MRWSKARRHDLPDLLELLLEKEWRFVPITARLRRLGRAALPQEATVDICRAERLRGALMLSQAGLLLPAIAEGARLPAPPALRLQELLARAWSVMGPSGDVGWVEGLSPHPPGASVDYHLMVLHREAFDSRDPPEGPRGLVVRRTGPADLPALLPLQIRYELEEVVIHRDRFSESGCRLALRSSLRSQLLLMAELDGRAVAKAGTNARGFRVDQIGGVFTEESLRGSGVGFRVMHALLREIFAEKQAVSLFVKRRNAAALALYRKLGFQVAEDYRISYFRF